ncbi:VOC family protein [Paucibacter sp. AS339]|uniref:VOC family protein n=1 Tax=Paucibacter hankyongi TaxID=3133434 RepID=UPI0030954229
MNQQPNFILLYVASPIESAAFYARVLGREPVESSPTFAMFALDAGLMLGLWARHTVLPTVDAVSPHASGELAFAQASNEAVDAVYGAWRELGLPIIQSPTVMDFGYTFTAIDPDGHRLRVFAPNGQ